MREDKKQRGLHYDRRLAGFWYMDLVQPNVSYLIQANSVIPTEEFNERKCVAGHRGNSKPDGLAILEDEKPKKIEDSSMLFLFLLFRAILRHVMVHLDQTK
ncbi:hypothetical protein QLX08_005436 [Tetragonisca angustula]|uniref:Uncharacterized protein n=1 Tax=Tetragonisca angustula TaxID=166442 RepID=A0AAW0ZXY0_9HYME